MDRYFENGDIEEKRLIVSSMFPDFLEFYGTRHRTPRLNSAIALIYQNNSKLQGKKKGTSLSFLDLSHQVIPLGLAQSHHSRTLGLSLLRIEPLGSTLKGTKKPQLFVGAFCDPAGIRTQDPYIKSVLLYQLSYRIENEPLGIVSKGVQK